LFFSVFFLSLLQVVKLKVMSKDSHGKPVYKYITLRAQTNSGPTATVTASSSSPSVGRKDDSLSTSLGLRDVPKVCYTGKRGRPKTLKPGEFDPHESERQKIEAR
jgi:hypothetical protein